MTFKVIHFPLNRRYAWRNLSNKERCWKRIVCSHL